MKTIIRERYISKIKPFIGTPIIKILTGMRRVGKSTLMLQIKDTLLNDIPAENKIYINFEAFNFMSIKNSDDLKNYLQSILNSKDPSTKLYFFFDEIQLVENWERIVNALRLNENYDIYITGSNSNIISGELSTLLAGRFVEFEIQPFVFSEYKEQYAHLHLTDDELFGNYIKYGGMPSLIYFDGNDDASFKYLNDVYNTVVVKDVMQHNQIRDIDIFNRIMTFAVENIGHTFSASNIRNFLKSENRKVSVDTVLNYLDFLTKAFIIKKVSRYDTHGKNILKTEEKYYLTDHGFRSSLGFSNVKDIERVLENIIYIELLSRDYKVYIGKVQNREIDFVAEKMEAKHTSRFHILWKARRQENENFLFSMILKTTIQNMYLAWIN